MADSKEPRRPASAGGPGQPLPRLWKDPRLEDEDEAAPKSRKAKKSAQSDAAEPAAAKKSAKGEKSKAKSKSSGGKGDKDKEGGKGALIEETPTFDTHEARQRVRVMVGVGLALLLSTIGFVIYHQFAPEPPMEEGNPPEVWATAGANLERDEQEARVQLDRARELAKNGKVEVAVAMLKRVTEKYPRTAASREAKEAIDRPKQNLPLFPEHPTMVAKVAETAPAKPETVPVVDATKPTVAALAGANASLVLPANPGEVPTSTTPAPTFKPLPKGFRPREGTLPHATGWPLEIVGDRDGSPMMFVAGSQFLQGRDDADPNESPAHRVSLSSYYIDKHEVTVRQFNVFVREAGKRSERTRALGRDSALAQIDDDESRPVVMVSARDAADYAAWAGKRLPTEAQWEAAARTPDGRIFPWGPEPPSGDKVRDPRQIDPVMANPNDVSAYGVFDLAGNAAEWTKDWFEARYYQSLKVGVVDNPTGPSARPRSQQLVVKGSARDWVVSKREGIKFDARLPYLGFRCVLPVEGPGNVFEPPPAAPAPGQSPTAPLPGGASVPF